MSEVYQRESVALPTSEVGGRYAPKPRCPAPTFARQRRRGGGTRSPSWR